MLALELSVSSPGSGLGLCIWGLGFRAWGVSFRIWMANAFGSGRVVGLPEGMAVHPEGRVDAQSIATSSTCANVRKNTLPPT